MSYDFQPTWEARFLFDSYSDEMTKEVLSGICEGYIRANMLWMASMDHDVPCCLADNGVRYVLPIGCEDANHPCQLVRGAQEILQTQKATCIDIACYMAALLRTRGTPATVIFTNQMNGQGDPIVGQYHAIVETRNGTIDYTEDLIDGDLAQCSLDCAQPLSSRPAGEI